MLEKKAPRNGLRNPNYYPANNVLVIFDLKTVFISIYKLCYLIPYLDKM